MLALPTVSLLRQWLSEGLRKRMTTADVEQTRDVLAKLAPPSSLPGPYGGTCKAMPADVRQLLGLDSKPRSSLERMFGPGKLCTRATPQMPSVSCECARARADARPAACVPSTAMLAFLAVGYASGDGQEK